MKTKLLYLTSIMLVFMTACSLDEHSNELSVDEKEMKVTRLFDSFSKSIVDSPSFSKFREEIQTKSSSELTEEELQQLEQEFLSQQSAEFIELYNYVVALDLSKAELRSIVLEYIYIFGKNAREKIGDELKDSDECSASDTSDSSGSSLLILILAEILCEVSSNSN